MLENVYEVFTISLDDLYVTCSIVFNGFIECLLCYASESRNQRIFEFMNDVRICEEYLFFKGTPFKKILLYGDDATAYLLSY